MSTLLPLMAIVVPLASARHINCLIISILRCEGVSIAGQERCATRESERPEWSIPSPW